MEKGKKGVHEPAKRRRRTVKRHYPAKRRKIGAVAVARKGATAGMMDILMVAGGAIGGSFLDKIIPATWDAKMKGGVKLAAGLFLPQLVKDQKTKKTMTLLGYGLAANGGIQLATGFNIISGLGTTQQLKDDDLLVVSLDGIDDRLLEKQKEKRKSVGEYTDFDEVLNDDILNGDDIPVVSGDDIPVVSDDILNEQFQAV